MYNNSKNCFRHPYHVQPEITVKTTDIVNEPSHFWLSKLCKKSAWKYLTTLLVCVFFVSLASQTAMAAVCPDCNGTGLARYGKIYSVSYGGDNRQICSDCGQYDYAHVHKPCFYCHGTRQIQTVNERIAEQQSNYFMQPMLTTPSWETMMIIESLDPATKSELYRMTEEEMDKAMRWAGLK